MIPFFTEIDRVCIYGHSDEAVKYAQMLDDVKQVFYFSFESIDAESLETLRALPNVQIYEKTIPVEHITSSELLIAASEDDEENVGVIDKVAGIVPLIAAVHPYAGVNVSLGERLKDEESQIAAYSKTNRDMLKELDLVTKEESQDLESLKSVLDLLEETGERRNFTEDDLDLIYKMSPQEREDLADRMMENYSLNRPDYRFLYFSGDFEKNQAQRLVREFEEELRSKGFEQEVTVEEIENPYDIESNEEFHGTLREIQNELFLHDSDALLFKDAYSFNVDPGLDRIVGLNSRGPLKYFLIGKDKVGEFFEVKSGSKIGFRDEKVFFFLWEQEDLLAQIHHEETWEVLPVETSGDLSRALDMIGIDYDYLLADSVELNDLGLSVEDLEQNGLHVMEIDMTPMTEQPVINAVVRKTDHYLKNFFNDRKDEATEKACDAQELILRECMDSFYPADNSFVSTYAEFDPKTRTYHLEVIGDERHWKRSRVKLDDVPEEELWPAVRKLRSIIEFDFNYGTGRLTDYTWRHLDELKGNLSDEDVKKRGPFSKLEHKYAIIKEHFYDAMSDDFRNGMLKNMNDEVVLSGKEPSDRTDDMIELMVQKEIDEKLQEIEEKGIEVYLFP